MAKTVTHTTVAAGVDDPTKEVSKNAWNAGHTVTISNLVNADIDAAAAIAESKLALSFATHDNANDPTSDEKDAMTNAATAPTAANPFVTEADLPTGTIVLPLPVGLGSFSPVDATTYYFGAPITATPITVGAFRKVIIRHTGTINIVDLIWTAVTTAGTNENVSIYIRVNDTTDTLIATVGSTDANKYFYNAAVAISVTPGDFIELKLVCPTWGTNPTPVFIGGLVYLELA